jgi:hypothetical protein
MVDMGDEYWGWIQRKFLKEEPRKTPDPEPTEEGVQASEPIRVELEDRNASTSKIKMVRDAWDRITKRG